MDIYCFPPSNRARNLSNQCTHHRALFYHHIHVFPFSHSCAFCFRFVQHLRVFPSTAANLPESHRPAERRRSRDVPAQTRGVQEEGVRWVAVFVQPCHWAKIEPALNQPAAKGSTHRSVKILSPRISVCLLWWPAGDQHHEERDLRHFVNSHVLWFIATISKYLLWAGDRWSRRNLLALCIWRWWWWSVLHNSTFDPCGFGEKNHKKRDVMSCHCGHLVNFFWHSIARLWRLMEHWKDLKKTNDFMASHGGWGWWRPRSWRLSSLHESCCCWHRPRFHRRCRRGPSSEHGYAAMTLISALVLQQTLHSHCADYVKKYATEEALREQEDMSTSSESSMSDFSEDEAQDMEL